MTEFWVMRIVCAVPGPNDPPLTSRVASDVAAGRYQVVNGEVVEPIVDFADQEQAMIRAQIETHRRGQAHKVVMSADLDDLGI